MRYLWSFTFKSIVLSAVLLLSILGGSALAANLPDGYQQGLVNVSSSLNVRQSPSASTAKVGSLNKNARVAICQSQDSWYKIVSQTGVTGWVNSQYIIPEGAKASSVQVAKGFTPLNAGASEPPQPPIENPDDNPQLPQGIISITGEKTAYGSKIILKSSQAIKYSIKRDGNGLSVNLNQPITGDLPALGAYDLALTGDNKVLSIGSTDYFYYDEDISSNSCQLTLELGSNVFVGRLIYLDPGHGTYESGTLKPGAIGPNGVKEMDVVLDITLKLRDNLVAMGADVRLTHDKIGGNLLLSERAKMANAAKADVFVSIHANSFGNASANGSSTWFYAPSSGGYDRAARQQLAKIMQESLLSSGGRANYGIREANFQVLRDSKMP
ncbi:MAG: N-acetylmuramoyl-L-alanine amidase, partial [Clostridiales bacterium]